MVIGDGGAIGSQAAVNKEDPGLQISVAEKPKHLHSVGDMSAREPSPQAHHIQGSG